MGLGLWFRIYLTFIRDAELFETGGGGGGLPFRVFLVLLCILRFTGPLITLFLSLYLEIRQ